MSSLSHMAVDSVKTSRRFAHTAGATGYSVLLSFSISSVSQVLQCALGRHLCSGAGIWLADNVRKWTSWPNSGANNAKTVRPRKKLSKKRHLLGMFSIPIAQKRISCAVGRAHGGYAEHRILCCFLEGSDHLKP